MIELVGIVLAGFSVGIILGYLIARRTFKKVIACLDLRHHQDNRRERLEELREKMQTHQLTNEDVDELLYLNWMVEGTWDERDNYTRYLKPPE